MARKNKQSYITIPSKDMQSQDTAQVEAPIAESVEVSYRLENIAEEQRGKLVDRRRPTAFLVSHDTTPIRPLALRARDNRMDMYHAYAGNPKNILKENGIALADNYSKSVFDNSYAVFQAAQSCNAQLILLIDSHLADDKVFLGLAQSQGMKVYRCVMADATWDTWTLCETNNIGTEVEWTKCGNCDLLFDNHSLALSHHICPNCGKYHRMTSLQRIDDLVDVGSFVEWDKDLPCEDPLEFPGYVEKITTMRANNDLDEAIRCGVATIASIRTVVCVMDSQFLMGSMGSIVGEKITRAVERATQEGLPVVVFTASGGARMQEGLMSLMQMAKVSCAFARHSDAGNLFISVLTDPTTGGVTASFAMQGDIILAEPKALIGFAGQRVIKSTINQELPEGFQTAEFALEHGLIDAIVGREKMRETLVHLLAQHKACSDANTFENGDTITYVTTCAHLKNQVGRYQTASSLMPTPLRKVLKTASEKANPNTQRKMKLGLFAKKEKTRSQDFVTERPISSDLHNPAWENVKIARNQNRPTARYYIDSIVHGFIELHGDRSGADDQAIVCGLGWIGSQPVTVIAQEKGHDLKSRLAHNFGCPQPWGYRKSLRFMKQAAKFGRPVVCLIDTPGAHPGLEAEERGQGNAIAENLVELASLPVPVISVVIGEGGSGGALALALADRVAMLEHAVYSILSPEGFASILWKDKDKAPEAAAAMKMSAHESCDMGIIDQVLTEGEGPAHENPETAAAHVKNYLLQTLDELTVIEPYHLVEQRHRRFRKF